MSNVLFLVLHLAHHQPQRKLSSERLHVLIKITAEVRTVLGPVLINASCNEKLQISAHTHITSHLDTKSPNTFAFDSFKKYSFLKAE